MFVLPHPLSVFNIKRCSDLLAMLFLGCVGVFDLCGGVFASHSTSCSVASWWCLEKSSIIVFRYFQRGWRESSRFMLKSRAQIEIETERILLFGFERLLEKKKPWNKKRLHRQTKTWNIHCHCNQSTIRKSTIQLRAESSLIFIIIRRN